MRWRRRWRRCEGRGGGRGLLTWHMIDGFSVFCFSFFLFLLVVVVGGVVERRRERMVFNTAGAGGEDCLSSVCVGKEDEFALYCGFTHSKGQGLA